MSEEWGPWIEHDGGPCPIKGQAELQAELRGYGLTCRWIKPARLLGGWRWDEFSTSGMDVIRYRFSVRHLDEQAELIRIKQDWQKYRGRQQC